ncbi:hypothetical protein D3C85_1382620 [compost metagenome]
MESSRSYGICPLELPIRLTFELTGNDSLTAAAKQSFYVNWQKCEFINIKLLSMLISVCENNSLTGSDFSWKG